MNALFSSRSIRWLLLFALGVGILPLFAAGALAADGPVVAVSSLQADFIMELISNRARLMQVSIVFVAFGIALLWWSR
jgi:hypothetical protein